MRSFLRRPDESGSAISSTSSAIRVTTVPAGQSATLDGTVAAAAAEISPSVVTIAVRSGGSGGVGSGVVLDTVPEAPRVSLAAGTGRHRSFAALFGRVLADLALTGHTRRSHPAFALDRGALVDAGA